MIRISHIVTAILLGYFTLAVQAKSSATPTRMSSQNRLSDAEIDHNIRIKLAKSKIGKDGFKASVKGGIVTWEGTTTVIQHKGAATRMAKTSGAVGVVNNIRINEKGNGPIRHAEVKTN